MCHLFYIEINSSLNISRTKKSKENSDFSIGRLVGQSEGGLSQRQTATNHEITRYTVYRIIVQLKEKGKTSTS